MRRSIALLALAISVAQALEVPIQGEPNVHVGAIASNGAQCAPIGRDILKAGGSAADAAIAVLACEGLTGPQSMGIGGGFLATYYDRKIGNVSSLVAREMAPAAATENMFVNDSEITGGKAAAVPGEVKGYWELHQKYGKLPWKDLFQATIKLCEDGVPVDKFLALTLQEYKHFVTNSATLRAVYINNATEDVYIEGDLIKYPTLAKTFTKIANEGVGAIYGNSSDGPVGSVGRDFIKDVRELGGIITEQDLLNYKCKWGVPIIANVTDDYTLYSACIPGSGPILANILNLCKNRVAKVDSCLANHWIIEAFKHGYGYRSQLTDDDIDPSINDLVNTITSEEHTSQTIAKISNETTSSNTTAYGADFAVKEHGTSNIAVLDTEGNACVITSTVNNIFGSRTVSPRTGIIPNDEMDDFSTPGKTNSYGFAPSPSNYIVPRKRPISSMSPSIILDKDGNVRLLIGAAGGSQITTSVALTTVRHLYYGLSLEEAIAQPRIHHQLLPMAVRYEDFGEPRKVDEDTLTCLSKKGHALEKIPTMLGFGAVTGVSVLDGQVTPANEKRRGGSVATIGSSEVQKQE